MRITFDVRNDAGDERVPVNVNIILDGEDPTNIDGQLNFTPYELVAFIAALKEERIPEVAIAASGDLFVISETG